MNSGVDNTEELGPSGNPSQRNLEEEAVTRFFKRSDPSQHLASAIGSDDEALSYEYASSTANDESHSSESDDEIQTHIKQITPEDIMDKMKDSIDDLKTEVQDRTTELRDV